MIKSIQTIGLIWLLSLLTTTAYAAKKQYNSGILTGKALANMRDTVRAWVNDYDAKTWYLHQVENNLILRSNTKERPVKTAFCAMMTVEVSGTAFDGQAYKTTRKLEVTYYPKGQHAEQCTMVSRLNDANDTKAWQDISVRVIALAINSLDSTAAPTLAEAAQVLQLSVATNIEYFQTLNMPASGKSAVKAAAPSNAKTNAKTNAADNAAGNAADNAKTAVPTDAKTGARKTAFSFFANKQNPTNNAQRTAAAASTPTAVYTIPTLTVSMDFARGDIKIACDVTDYGAHPITWEEYDLEWAFIDDYGAVVSGLPTKVAPIQLTCNFKRNCTRVRLTNSVAGANTYYIPAVYERGYLVFRCRAVTKQIGPNGVYLHNGQFIDKYGPWSAPEKGAVATYPAANRIYIDDVQTLTSPQKHTADKLNWQLETTYAEDGKRKDVVGYFDGALRNRQKQTRLNTDQDITALPNVVIGETYYDHTGRPAVEVLPVPIDESILKYRPDFNVNAAGNAFSALDFDESAPISPTDPTVCENEISTMSITSGASKYYSPNNVFYHYYQQNMGLTQYRDYGFIPDAKGYPFVQTVYTPDNTGRVSAKGGVGKTHQIDKGHDTKYFYADAFQVELDRLFG
ncbi:MAG: hypothetical protein RI894_826, partial [Bacteroidota bacterium]